MSPCRHKNIRITQVGVTTNFIGYLIKGNILGIASTIQFCGISYSDFLLMDR